MTMTKLMIVMMTSIGPVLPLGLDTKLPNAQSMKDTVLTAANAESEIGARSAELALAAQSGTERSPPELPPTPIPPRCCLEFVN